MHKPKSTNSSAPDSRSLRSPPSPLTRENLMTLEESLDHEDAYSNEILQRFCREINSSNNAHLHQAHVIPSKSSIRERCQSTPPQIQKNDVVVASPKLLPFPYHNDSLFLPTAEKIQYHNHFHSSTTTTSLSSSSRADSSSLSPESEVLISRPYSTTNIPNSPSMKSLTSINNASRPSNDRRSLPIKLDYSNIVISSTGSKKQRFLNRSSSYGSLSTVSSAGYNTEKKPWLKRIFKFFNKNKHKSQQIKQSNLNSNNDVDGKSRVWYCKYSKNPSTDFENYYHHHQYQHQQPMISVIWK